MKKLSCLRSGRKHQNIRREVMTAYSRHTQTAYSTKRKKENPRKLNERRGSRLKTTFNEFMESVLEPARKSSIIHCAPS